MLFSATFPKHVHAFASKFAPNANKIELRRNEITVENIKQFYMDCRDEGRKYDVLVQLYHILTIGQSIIFCEVCCFLPRPILFEPRLFTSFLFDAPNSAANRPTRSRNV